MTIMRSLVLRLSIILLIGIQSIQELSAQCNIEVTAEIVNCSDALNTFNALITVTGTDVGSTFVLGGNGLTFGSFSYNSAPIEIGPFTNNGGVYNFAAIDNTNLTCFGEAQILPYDDCPTECELDIVDVEFLVCDGLNRYANIYIENSTNVSQDFTLLVNQVSQGTFSYGQAFYTIGPLAGNCMEGIGINAFDNGIAGCSDFYWQPGPYCCPDECSINDIIVDTYCVNDEIAGIIVDFNYNGASNEQFEIVMDSIPVDTSFVFEFPDTIFYNFTGQIPEIIMQGFGVNHVAKPNCGFYGNYEISCDITPPCSFNNIIVSPITCDGENTYSLGIDFQVQSATSIFFDVYSGSTFLGNYLYADLPVVVDNFPEREADNDIITICDNGNNSCCETIEFTGLDCDATCSYSNYFIEAHECDEQGMFNMYIQFDHENVGDQGFIVRGNGIIYDTFQYSDAGWYTFGPLFADCETVFEFIVIDIEDPSCSIDAGFDEPICCEVEQTCMLSNLTFDNIGCQGNQIGFTYSFDFTGNTDDSYDLFVGDVLIGFYPFSSDPQEITVPSNEFGLYQITICENDNEDCCITDVFQAESCDEECSLTGFFIEAQDCGDSGMFEVDLEFIVENNVSSSFTVFGDGNNYGSFEYGETFYTVGPFAGDCETVYEFIVIDNDAPDCTTNYLFLGPICCDQPECNINNLVVTPIECVDNNIYSITIDFNYVGVDNDFFDVIVDNEIIGFYALADLPITIDYPASGNDNDVLSVCINDNADCCAIAEFEALDCELSVGDCGIDNVFAEAGECTEDGGFFVDVEFDVVDGGAQGFEIRGNGVSYGTFTYGETNYSIGLLEGDCETIYEFIIIDIDDPTCFGEYVFEEPICCDNNNEDCIIDDVIAEPYECDEEGNFLVDIAFVSENGSDQGFEIRGNGTSYGIFDYGADFYTIGPLAGDCETIYEFIIIDQADMDCSAFTGFEEPICCDPDACNITNLEAELISCDSTEQIFFVGLSFDVVNNASQFFNVGGSGEDYGSFGYGQDNYTIGPLEADGETIYEFVIWDIEDEECSSLIEFGPIDCMTSSTQDELFDSQVSAYYHTGLLYLNNPNQHKISNLQIFNLDGKFLYGNKSLSTQATGELSPNINQSGIYILVVTIEGKHYSIKLPLIE